jgi:hypothetical protein
MERPSTPGTDLDDLRAVAEQLKRRQCSLARNLGRRLDDALRTADALAAVGADEMAAKMRADAWDLGGRFVR